MAVEERTDTVVASPGPAEAAPASPRPRRGFDARGFFSHRVAPLLLIALFLGVWEVLCRALDVKTYLLPTPSRIWEELVRQGPSLVEHTWITTYEMLLGFILAAVVGILLAVFIVSSPVFDRSIMPVLIFSQTIPKIAIAPLFIVWFGFGPTAKVLVAFLICFFPIVIDTAVGLRSVSPDMLNLARSMGASWWDIFVKIRVPTALPYIFSGLKVAITLAVVGAVVGEFVGATKGLGYILLKANGELQTPLLFAAIAILTAIGIIFYYVLEAAERVMIPWHVSRRGQEGGWTM
jgi:NitT/TauT family transport system permease protein